MFFKKIYFLFLLSNTSNYSNKNFNLNKYIKSYVDNVYKIVTSSLGIFLFIFLFYFLLKKINTPNKDMQNNKENKNNPKDPVITQEEKEKIKSQIDENKIEIEKSKLKMKSEIYENKIKTFYEQYINLKERFNEYYEDFIKKNQKFSQEDIINHLINKFSEKEIEYIMTIYHFLDNEFYRETKKIKKDHFDKLSESSQNIIEELINSQNYSLYEDKNIFKLIFENKYSKIIKSSNYVNFINEINQIEQIFESEDYIKSNEDVRDKNQGYLLQKINMEELFKNQDFITYMKKKESLKKYNLNNSGEKNNCYFYSLIHMITVHIFKIKEDKNLTKTEKEKFISDLLYEYEIVSLSMEEFLKESHNNENKNDMKLIQKNFNTSTKNFFNKFQYNNQASKINLDNEDFYNTVSKVLSKFFYYYIALARGPYCKDYDFAQDYRFIDTSEFGEPFWLDSKIFSSIKEFKILPNIFSYDNGVMKSHDSTKYKIKHFHYKHIYNPLLFEQYNEDDRHFTCNVLMTPEEYNAYKEFLTKLQTAINQIDKTKFENIVPFNFKDRDFLVDLDLVSKIP
jgi:hypothetical protein